MCADQRTDQGQTTSVLGIFLCFIRLCRPMGQNRPIIKEKAMENRGAVHCACPFHRVAPKKSQDHGRLGCMTGDMYRSERIIQGSWHGFYGRFLYFVCSIVLLHCHHRILFEEQWGPKHRGRRIHHSFVGQTTHKASKQWSKQRNSVQSTNAH